MMDKKILVAFVTALSGLSAQARTAAPYIQVNDTIARDLSDLETMLQDSVVADNIDTTYYGVARQRNFNALKFSLDGRHRFKGDKYVSKGAFDHTYIEFGGGIRKYRQSVIPYQITPQTNLNLYFGKELSPMSSYRIGISGGATYMKDHQEGIFSSNMFWSARADVDYLYNFSNYLLGYRPDRPLQVSGILGLGVQTTRLEYYNDNDRILQLAKKNGLAYDFHSGLQFKFFAGSHSAITLEPYFSFGSENSVLKLDKSDNVVDITYGVNLSYIYYFNSILSDEGGDLKRHYQNGYRYFNGDSAMVHKRSPFFFEYAIGPSWMKNFPRSYAGGYSVTSNVGMWLSSAIGWRAGLNGTNTDWKQFDEKTGRYTKGGLSFDALLNPFGFHRNYNWDSRFGLNLFGGYEFGRVRLTNTDTQEVNKGRYIGYRTGFQLWAKLTNDLRLNIEPSYTKEENYLGRQGGRYRYEELGLKAGLTVMFRSPKNRTAEDAVDDRLLSGLFVGGGLGWSSSIYRWRYNDYNTGYLKSGLAFVGYNLNDISGVKLMGEYLEDRLLDADAVEHPLHVMRSKVVSLDYQLDLLNLMTGYKPSRRWGVHVYAGPSYVWGGEDPSELGFNVGGQLSYRVSRNLSLFYSHTAYWLGNRYKWEQEQVHYLYGTLINSLSVGLIYSFNSFKKDNGYNFTGSHPFFVEYGVGMGMFPTLPSKGSDSWGATTSAGFGAWMTPFIGARLGFSANKGVASTQDIQTGNMTHTLYNSVGIASGNLDLLINPFGFAKDYKWDQPFGVNFIVGYQKGYYTVTDMYHSAKGWRQRFDGVRLGGQVWARLTKNLRFFVEPVFSKLDNENMYINDETLEVSNEKKAKYSALNLGNNFSVKAGLTLFLSKVSERDIPEEDQFTAPSYFAGIGGGFNVPLEKRHFESEGSKLNGIVFGGYRFSELSSVRASFEVMNDGVTEANSYKIKGSTSRTYQYLKSDNTVGFFSVDYQLDLMSWFNGYSLSRKWDASIYAGPSVALRISDSLKDQDGNEFSRKNFDTSRFGLNLGMILEYNFNRSWSAFYNHNVYGFGLWDKGHVFNTSGIVSKVTALNSFNIGIIHKF